MIFKGLFTAVITPFDSHDQLDEEGFRENLRFQIAEGVDGIVVLGTTGESPTIEEHEKQRILEISVEEVKGKTKLIVGTGSYSTKETIANTREAEAIGADGALVILPYYNRPSQEGLYHHIATVCEATDIPMIIYNHPGRTGNNLQNETLKRLAAFPNVVGVKDVTTITQVMDIVEMIIPFYPHFTILTGDDPITLPLMAAGGHGVISVASNLVPAVMKSLVDACARGDFVEARRLHYQLMPFYRASTIEINPTPIKAAMNICGMAAGSCRPPLAPLQPANQQKLVETIQALPQHWIKSYACS